MLASNPVPTLNQQKADLGIPRDSLKPHPALEALIKQTGTLRYAFQAKATGANLTGTTNTVYATLIIGGDSGATSVTAEISH